MCTARITPVTVAITCVLLVAPTVSAAVELPDGSKVEKVDFERHVMGLLGKMGCNAGACHGSFKGRGGFRLSLFASELEKDHAALTGGDVPRTDRDDPEASLLLRKPTRAVAHGGGLRFEKDSWQYRLFRTWIQQGARWDKGSGAVAALRIEPPELAFTRPGQTGRVKVWARFNNGDEVDVSTFCLFRSNNEAIAEVTPLGEVRSRQPGDTFLVASYRSEVVAVRTTVPREAPEGFQYPKVPEASYIDREVFAKLRRLNVVPSDLADDAEFLRRVTIDTIGALPTPDEVRAFLADRDSDKRTRKIDQLLAHPMHAALWASRLSDVTGNTTAQLELPLHYQPERSQMWHDWLRKRLADNMPYDEIVKGILCATSRDGLSVGDWIKQADEFDAAAQKGKPTTYAQRNSLDLFWRRERPVALEQWAERTAAAFLGVRLECAQCHKHPFDRWTQNDYRAYANVFAQVSFGASPEAKLAIDAANQRRGGKSSRNQAILKEVFVGPPVKRLEYSDAKSSLPAKALGGPEIPLEDGTDARATLLRWMRSPENPFFARAFVNRVWGHYFGVGIVDPVDDFSLSNSPSNEKLLQALARDFIEHKFDIRRIERTLLQSRTYQLTSKANATNRLDKSSFSHSYVRPMLAEVAVDVLNAALGINEDFGPGTPLNGRAIEIGASRVENRDLMHAFGVFGRPLRLRPCECEREAESNVPQALFLMTDSEMLRKLKAGARLNSLLKGNQTDEQILEELFLATLSRFPRETDREAFAEYRKSKPDRENAFRGTLWALVNTREFILNH
jgi:hypothetical protein